MATIPKDEFKSIIKPVENVPLDFLPEPEELDNPLTILLRKEANGEFLFSEDNGPYNNLY